MVSISPHFLGHIGRVFFAGHFFKFVFDVAMDKSKSFFGVMFGVVMVISVEITYIAFLSVIEFVGRTT